MTHTANDSQVKHSEKARQVFAKNTTPRWRALDTLEAYVDGRQYVGRPDWFNDDVPLLKRAPCVIEPIVESAIESYQDLIFGESRFPKITSGVQEDDRAFDQRFGLGPEDSATLDHLIQAVIKQANVAEVSREALARAMGSRTAVGIAAVKDGRLTIDLEPAKCCTPTFDPMRPNEIVALEIRYPYIELYWDSAEKSWAEKCMLYRRVIDAQNDITYRPVKAPEDGTPVSQNASSWSPHIEVYHRLGFCPVVWYPYRKINSKRSDVDGIAIHERLLDEIDAFNRTLSQRHRAGIYCGDPQIIEIGVGADEDSGPSGQTSQALNTYVDESGRILPNAAGAFSMYTPGTASTGARKKGPNVTWRYSNPSTKVEFLQLHDTALRPLDEEADRLRSLLAEGMSWVRPLEASSSNSKINVSRLSGKTLRLLYKRQTSQCDTIRPDTWNGWLYPLISLLLRIVYEYAKDKSRGALYLGGIEQAQALLERFDVKIEGPEGATRWFNPSLTPVWGAYFEPDEQDQLLTSQQLAQDFTNGFITLRTAVQKQASFYAIDNVDAYMKELEAETAKRKQEEMDRTVEEATKIHDATSEPDVPAFGSGK